MKILIAVAALLLAGCESKSNMVVAPKPAEANPQFVLERKNVSTWGEDTPSIYVFRDNVNGKLIYAVPGCGIAVEDRE